MKTFFKIILKYYLKYITKLVLILRRPRIVAVCGNSNKTFVRDEIVKVLKKKNQSVRANPKNFNTEIGLPLAILGVPSGYNSYRGWLPSIAKAAVALFQKNFPLFLVLELGISQKGDMKYLLSIVKPEIFVVSDITQRYTESFSNLEEFFGEYELEAKMAGKGNWLVLNSDNSKVRNLAKFTRSKTVFFGKSAGDLGWKVTKIEREVTGQKITIFHQGKEKKYETNRFGNHHALALAAALAVEEIIFKKY